MSRKSLLCRCAIALLALFPVQGVAQTAGQEAERQFGEDIDFPALPFYSFGSGLGWTTPDSTFRLNIRFRMQNRATFIEQPDGDDSIDMAVRRLRLRFDGFVGRPEFTYVIQLSFAPEDVGSINAGDNLNVIRDAAFFYQPNRNWSFGFGQTKLPGNRQRLNSSGGLQLTDRSINNARFNIDRDFGFFAFYLNEQIDRFSGNIKTAISTGNGRNRTNNNSTDLAYTARAELFPLGAFERNGMLFEGDLVREQTPKLLLGGTWHLNTGAQRSRGTVGGDLFERRELTSALFDAMLKYRGWAFQAAYMLRDVDDPVTVGPGGATAVVFKGDGFDLQGSYLFRNDFELIARYSEQYPDRQIRAIHPRVEQFSGGVTRYIREHALKLQLELTHTNESLLTAPSTDFWMARFQIEIGI
ncbi:MAG: porin [Balneolaceae bacterium]